MATEVQWIKITTDMFDNRKVKNIRRLPEGNNIMLIWVMLLTMAGRCNAGGHIFISQNIPYNLVSLSDDLNFTPEVTKLALETLRDYGMITWDAENFLVTNWEEYQNIRGLEKIREQNRIRKANYDARKKALEAADNKKMQEVTLPVTLQVTSRNATEEDIEEDKEIDIDIINNNTLSKIKNAWNDIGLAQITKIANQREKLLRARIREYGLDNVFAAIEIIKESPFLLGSNDKGWTITFDWFVCPNNFPKVLEGNYKSKPVNTQHKIDNRLTHGRPVQSRPFEATDFSEGV